MEVKIGVQNVAREITFETRSSAAEVEAAVESALSGGVLSLSDEKGRKVVVPGKCLGYVQMGESEKGRVGFGVS